MDERERQHLAQYQIISTTLQSHSEQYERAKKILRKKVRPEVISFERNMGEKVGELFGMGSHPYTKDGIERLVLYYSYHGLLGSPKVMSWILGREPMSFEGWLEGKVAASKGEKYELVEVKHRDPRLASMIHSRRLDRKL